MGSFLGELTIKHILYSANYTIMLLILGSYLKFELVITLKIVWGIV